MPHKISSQDLTVRGVILDTGEIEIDINDGEILFLKKCVKFKVLRGTCTLLGYHFHQSDIIFTFQIPKWHPSEPIVPLATSNDNFCSSSVKLAFIDYNTAFYSFSLADCVEDFPFGDNKTASCKEFIKVVPELWHKCADSVPKNGSLAVHGEKGVGKSTAAIYLTNYLLNISSKIAVIDVDIGQPLFTVPGIISLHILDKPILRPEYAMLNEQFVYSKQILIGDVSMANPKHLLECAISLEQFLRESIAILNIQDYRVIINTGGWISGMGGQIFDCLIKIFNVDVVLSILSKPDSVGYKPQLINMFSDIITQYTSSTKQPIIVTVNSYKIESNAGFTPRPSDLRWIRVASYLNPSISDSLEIYPFTHYEFFSAIHEYRLQYNVKNPSLFTPPIPTKLNLSNLMFYLPNGIELSNSQLQNHFIAGCIAALITCTNDNFHQLISSQFTLSFIHSICDNELLVLVPKGKYVSGINKIILCPMLGFDPQFPRFGRPSTKSFVPFERYDQLHLVKNLGTSNYSRRSVKKRPHDDEDKSNGL